MTLNILKLDFVFIFFGFIINLRALLEKEKLYKNVNLNVTLSYSKQYVTIACSIYLLAHYLNHLLKCVDFSWKKKLLV